MNRFVSEWKEWWQAQSPLKRAAPIALGTAYLVLLSSFGAFRTDHPILVTVTLLLWYAGPRIRTFFDFLIPLLLVAVIYDSMRIYADLIRGPIRVKEPYLFDKTLFGIDTPEGRLTPNEWWQKHTHPVLDLITGFFYLTFISIYVLVCMYFCFWLPSRGTALRSPEWIKKQAYRPMWAFFFVNMLGYSTYYWYPAAPPWYVADHGLGPADLTVAASAAGALRFDQMLGTEFFTGMYGRSADVFGAIPSLHVAYPLQAVFYAFRYGALRGFTLLFYLVMCFSAVYLNHHYILDILWGSVYALLVCLALEWLGKRKSA
jgi:membrane-associated phospholipid phosphatase